MNMIEKIVLFLKKRFTRQNKIKKLTETKIVIEQDKEEKFIESLKTDTIKENTKKEIETLTCNGDGLGVQKKITS